METVELKGAGAPRGDSQRLPVRFLFASWAVAVTGCSIFAAAAWWNSSQPNENTARSAISVLANSKDPTERIQAVTRCADEAIDILEALQLAAHGTDRAAADAREYLVQLSNFAKNVPPPPPEAPKVRK